MRPSLFALLVSLGLSACVATPAPILYQPAARPGAVGYFETPIERDRWRVSFCGGGGADARRIGQLAIRRAAELTLVKGYDWFRVNERTVEPASGAGLNVSGRGAFRVSLEVLMGRGRAPREPDALDARAVRRSFGPEV